MVTCWSGSNGVSLRSLGMGSTPMTWAIPAAEFVHRDDLVFRSERTRQSRNDFRLE